MRLALEIDPHYANAWHGLAVFHDFIFLGDIDKALAALRQAERLEPLSPAIACDFGFLFYWARQYAEAIDASRRALDLHPSFARTYVPLARAHAAQQHYDEAIEICLNARPLFHGRAFLGHLLATLGYCYGRSGRPAEAEAVIEEIRLMGREHYVSAYDVATIYVGMGKREQAMESLRTHSGRRACLLADWLADRAFVRSDAGREAVRTTLRRDLGKGKEVIRQGTLAWPGPDGYVKQENIVFRLLRETARTTVDRLDCFIRNRH
jgi:Flp pilus assembly protein TadD